MKSAHRHELETNVLAHRLEAYIARYRPYASRIVGVLIAIVAVILVWSFVANTSSARRSEAWDSYNRAIVSSRPDVEAIHQAAQDNPGTSLQAMADVTWADSQVVNASYFYLSNRKLAMESLDRAANTYQKIIDSSKDQELIGRARLGLARVLEMQNHLDKARDEYRKVTGAFAKYAQSQAERLEKPEAQETYAWLATAELPKPQAPAGPGTPGQRPEFSPGELSLPNASPDTGKADDSKGASQAFEDLLKSMKQEKKAGDTADHNPPNKKAETPGKESAGKPPADNKNGTESKGAATPPKADATGNKSAKDAPPTDKPAK